MKKSDPLREQLVRFLDWQEAHVGFEKAIDGIPPEKRGATPPGLPHSPWQILEHLRIAQEDIHDFCVNPHYKEMAWPADYWPKSAPPNAAAWDESVKAYWRDNEKMKELVRAQPDLFARIPHGTKPQQTYIRAVLLIVDHASYHVGQLVLVRRLLGVWKD
jgi:uncharacterized damage-inducible protein DinB